ncbi:PA14 domain-containing protein [uncultured Roseobacter sp.]|uniref:PA14 domain-containing protein n=1 Tax=uncultured Roseobacter sp. TaxID=114847 RepID=UPI002623FAC2|nr:PA14 domain-containing protein [uncultured Roseobacter sp.]
MFSWTEFAALLGGKQSAGTLVPNSSETRSGFYAEFYDISADKSISSLSQVDFSADPAHEEVISRIGYRGEDAWWDGGRGNFFAARFVAGVTVEKAGTYTFQLQSDSGAQLKLGGDVMIENYSATDPITQTVTLELEAGLVPLELLYFETRGDQTLRLKWSGPDTDGRMVSLRDVVIPLGDKPDDGGSDQPDNAPPAEEPQDGGGNVPPADLPPGFQAAYFDISADKSISSLSKVDFSADPAYKEVVSEVDYSGEAAWWTGGRGNFFAAQLIGGVVVEKAGSYTFSLLSDSGAQLKFGDSVVIENDTPSGTSEGTVTVQLEAGVTPIEILYFETRGAQTLKLQWSGPDTGGKMVVLDSAVLLEGVSDDPGPVPDPDPDPVPDPDPDPDSGSGQPPDPDPDPTPDPDPDPDTGSGGGSGDPQEPVLPRIPAENNGDGPDRLEAQEFTPGETLAVSGGRTTTLQIDTGKTIESLEIIDGPDVGHVTVNPDNTFALVLSGTDYAGDLSFDYKVTYANGSTGVGTAQLDVQTPTQGAGWGMGEHYMLETGSDGEIVVETGDNHRKVYVSESKDALSLKDIAAREGIAVGDIDTKWMLEHTEYGATEDMALASDAGMMLWYGLTGSVQAPNSHWLLFERGYTYDDVGKVVTRGTTGESELHPVYITSYGNGAPPVLDTSVSISQLPSQNVVMSDLKILGGVGVKNASNVLMTDLDLFSDGMGIRDSDHITLHDSTISYTITNTADGSGVTQGLLGVNTSNLLVEGNVFHHNAWREGYNMDGTGHAPDQFSHNVYLQWNTSDVTYRDNISSQSASIGAQLRGGAYAENNLFTDNNVAVNFLGGNYKKFGHVGNFTYFADNVITSGAYKDAQSIGAKGWGASNGGYETTLLDNIIAHLANPDDPSDLQDKQVSSFAVAQKDEASFFYDDTKVLNWLGADPVRWKDAAMDRNLDGTDVDQAMQTTIQRYADQLTDGQEATIDGLMDYILSLSGTAFDDLVSASDIVDYFQNGFGIALDSTTDVKAHRFIPNDLGDGIRWDNGINWDSGELPTDGDQVDLGGNWVNYGMLTTRIDDLDLGAGGRLSVSSGLLEVRDVLATGGADGRVLVDGSGQFWADGYTAGGELQVDVAGGRFVNTDKLTGDLQMLVRDNAQAILATDKASMVLSKDSELRIEGSDAKVGFDGDSSGNAILQMEDDASLSFVADADGFSTLEEFRSGAWDQTGSPVRSGVSLDGTLQIDLSAYQGGAGTHKLIGVDALHGMFDEIRVIGLDNGYTAQTIIDFQADEIIFEISKGNASPGAQVIGNPNSGSGETQSLWDALRQGQGSFDDDAPRVIEDSEIDLLF